MSVSALLLERPGRWRPAGLAALIVVAMLPALPLFLTLFQGPDLPALKAARSFAPLAARSMATAAAGGLVSLLVGGFAGITQCLYRFGLAALFRFVMLLPLVAPPLLWAVGFRNLCRWHPGASFLFSGWSGMVSITAITGVPLVMLGTIMACNSIGNSQCLAARLAGGEKTLLRLVARQVFPVSLLAACLAACLTLSVPGPAMALGVKSAVSEILLSFSALYNLKLAALQSLLLASGVMVVMGAAMVFAGSSPATLLVSVPGKLDRIHHRGMSFAALVFHVAAAAIFVLLPCAGLVGPAFSSPFYPQVVNTVARTLGNTLFYAGGAGLLAAFMGILAVFFMGRFNKYRVAGFCFMAVIIALPPALGALGFAAAAAHAPAWADLLFRGGVSVCIVQGLRLFPFAALAGARFFASMPPSWVYAAEMQGVDFWLYTRKVTGTALLRIMAVSFLTGFLLSAADAGTVLLLHPPGAQNLPLAIFTVMANAPAGLTAQLSLVYIAAAALFLSAIMALERGLSPKRINNRPG